MVSVPKLIIPSAVKDTLHIHELEAARALLRYFQQDVEFLIPSRGYKVKTPDVLIGNTIAWEIKCPTGSSGRAVIQRQFKGLRQSRNLVIDGRWTKMEDGRILGFIKYEINQGGRRSRRVLYINKMGDVVDCK